MLLIPDFVIEVFLVRIKNALDENAVEREINRIKILNNNKIPEKIQNELNKRKKKKLVKSLA